MQDDILEAGFRSALGCLTGGGVGGGGGNSVTVLFPLVILAAHCNAKYQLLSTTLMLDARHMSLLYSTNCIPAQLLHFHKRTSHKTWQTLGHYHSHLGP